MGLRGPVAAGLGRAAVGYFRRCQGLTEANQANLAAGTEAEPNQALGWLPMDIDAAAEAAAQPFTRWAGCRSSRRRRKAMTARSAAHPSSHHGLL